MALSYMSKIGFVKEATFGVGGSPTVMLPVAPFSFTIPYEQILDDSLRGLVAKDYAAYQGVGRIEGSLEGNFYPEELGHFLLGILGSVTTSGTAAPYEHTFKFAATPPSFAFTDDNPVQNYRYFGMMFSEFALRFNSAEGLLTWTASLIGQGRGKVPTDTVPSEATKAPFRGWMTTVYIGSTASPYGKVLEGEITIAREVTLHYTGEGIQYPGTAFAGPIEVRGRLTLFWDSDKDYDRYINKTQELVKIVWKYGSGTGLKELTFTAEKVDFGEGPVELDRSGPTITLAYDMRALYNTTDAGSCRFILKNAQSSY